LGLINVATGAAAQIISERSGCWCYQAQGQSEG